MQTAHRLNTRRREWRCDKCLVTLGHLTTDRDGRDHLKALVPPAVSAAKLSEPDMWEIQCACGWFRPFRGWTVHFEPVGQAA